MNTHFDFKSSAALGWSPSLGYLLTMVGGLAIAAVGCGDRDEAAVGVEAVQPPNATAALVVSPPAQAPLAPNTPKQALQASPAQVVPTLPETSSGAAALSSAPAVPAVAVAAKPASLTVKRFVVTTGVENREPHDAGETLTLGEPVFAFAELASGAGAEAGVEIVFEHEGGRKVGHAKLEIPAEKSRWRTWGQSRNIKIAGRWTAVLLDGAGAELSRDTFTVAAPELTPEVAAATETLQGG